MQRRTQCGGGSCTHYYNLPLRKSGSINLFDAEQFSQPPTQVTTVLPDTGWVDGLSDKIPARLRTAPKQAALAADA